MKKKIKTTSDRRTMMTKQDYEKELIIEKTDFLRAATRLLGAVTEAFITLVTPAAIAMYTGDTPKVVVDSVKKNFRKGHPE